MLSLFGTTHTQQSVYMYMCAQTGERSMRAAAREREMASLCAAAAAAALVHLYTLRRFRAAAAFCAPRKNHRRAAFIAYTRAAYI